MFLRKNTWVMIAVAIALIIALPVAAAGQRQAPEGRVVIGYAPSDWDPSDFHGMFGEGIEEGLREHGIDYEFLIRPAGDHTTHEVQLSIVEDFIAEGVDYLVINPTDFHAQRVSYQRVIDAGIPLFVGNFNIPFPDEWGIQPLMLSGYSHEIAGLEMVDYIAERYAPGTKMAIIQAAPGYISDMRGQIDAHKANGIDIVYTEYAYGNRADAYDTMERIMTAYPDTKIILTLSSMMAMGAVEAVQSAGRVGDFDIYGAGGTIEELLAIEEGTLAGAWLRDNVAMGKAVADAIKMHLDGRADEIEPIFNSPIHVVDTVEAINEVVNPVLYTAEGYDFPR